MVGALHAQRLLSQCYPTWMAASRWNARLPRHTVDTARHRLPVPWHGMLCGVG